MVDHSNKRLNKMKSKRQLQTHALQSSKNEITPRHLIDKFNAEQEKSDRLVIARLDSIVKQNKQDYKSNLMIEKYSLLPAQSFPLTPAQADYQRNILILRYNLLTPLDPQRLNIHKHPRHSCQLIHHYQLSESIYYDNLTSIKLSKAQNYM